MLYNPTAQTQEDPMRSRRRFTGDQGGVGMAGPEITLSRLLPLLMGVAGPNFSGVPSGVDFSALSQQVRAGAPAPDFRNIIGGPNVAPGSPNGLSGNQTTSPSPWYGSSPAGPTVGDTGGMPGGSGGPHVGDPMGHNPQGPLGSRPGRDGRMPGNPLGPTFSKPYRT
jgi:hypothetical protein